MEKMMARMDWRRARKTKTSEFDTAPLRQRWAERKADHMILRGDHPRIEAINIPPSAEKVSYRSVASVVQSGDQWLVVDGSGNTVGAYPARWQAWQHADKFGLEIAGYLPA